MQEDGRARFRRLRWLTILGPTLFMVFAEGVRYYYLRHVLAPLEVSAVAVTVTMMATGAFSTYIFAVISRMEKERNRYRESMMALNERERLAREMHDGLAQDLAVIKWKLHRLDEVWGDLKTRELMETRQLVERCYGEVRHNLYDLRAGTHLHEGLWQAIAIQVSDFRRQTGIAADWRVDQHTVEPKDPRVSVQILRIVQEALANVRKHAEASHVLVEARQRGQILCVSVGDDGRGVDRSTTVVEGNHFGLLVMQERAESVGAQLDIATGAGGRGTVVEIRLRVVERGGEAHRKGKTSVGG